MSRKAAAAAAEEDPQAWPDPRANPRLLGQAAAEDALLAAYRTERLPHAWLLTGPRGVGKATLAFRFARFLLARKTQTEPGGGLFGELALPQSDQPTNLALDPDDPVFRRVAASGHPDLVTVARTVNPASKKLRGEIVVDDVRAATGFLRHTSAEGGWRICIVDAADEMNPNAANALLKVLEEPPEQAILLLLAHAPGRLLPTIRSRCRQLVLPPLSETTVLQLLADFAPELSPEDATALARLSEGSIGRALALAGDGGLGLYRQLVGLLESLPRLDVAELHGFGDKLARDSSGALFRTVGELLSAWIGRLVLARAQGDTPLEILPGEARLIGRLGAGRSLASWLDLWDNLRRRFAQADGAALDRKQALIAAFLEIEALAS
ncbi:DNA polymerase III subunit delta' [Algihabitans albus]|uniref:DNA polymerase III subunit delta' n=1 Tax=Algihabitans albus TaxID=2164067 RepID=UPI000E5DA39D|nr:DNA polymerase III subunit delta' [Algihabitans albus]